MVVKNLEHHLLSSHVVPHPRFQPDKVFMITCTWKYFTAHTLKHVTSVWGSMTTELHPRDVKIGNEGEREKESVPTYL